MFFTTKSKMTTISQRHKGFTLAEVLITLGIIGVVAAITIPSLMQNSQDRAFVSMFKKDYAMLSDAISQANYEFDGMLHPENFIYHPSFAWNPSRSSLGNGHQINQLFLEKYLPVITQCSLWGCDGCSDHEWKVVAGSDTGNECWAGNSAYKGTPGLNGATMPSGASSFIIEDAGIKTSVLNNGSIIQYEVGPISTGTASWGNIIIDANGLKAPNIIGKDRFVTTIVRASEDSTNPLYYYAKLAPYNADPATTCVEGSTDAANTGLGCAAKAIFN